MLDAGLGPVYIHPGFQGGPGQIGVLNSDWLTIWDAVGAVGARRSEDAPLGDSCLTCWFQAAFLEAANLHWPLTSAGSLCWNWGELNFYWLATQAGSLGQPCGMLNCYWRRVSGCFPLRRRGRSRLGSLREASCGGVFSEGEGEARSPGQ